MTSSCCARHAILYQCSLVELGHSILVAAGRLVKGYLQRLGRFELVLFSTVLRGYEPAYLAQGVCIP